MGEHGCFGGTSCSRSELKIHDVVFGYFLLDDGQVEVVSGYFIEWDKVGEFGRNRDGIVDNDDVFQGRDNRGRR
jgi:hypothetical protein